MKHMEYIIQLTSQTAEVSFCKLLYKQLNAFHTNSQHINIAIIAKTINIKTVHG